MGWGNNQDLKDLDEDLWTLATEVRLYLGDSSLMDHTHIPTALNGAQWARRASSHHQQILCAAATEQVLHHGTEMGNALLELLRPVEAEADAKRLCCGRRSV
jgi:hypothetical protein